MSFDIAALNAMPAEDFIHALGGIFEHSPWIPASVVDARPFASLAALHAAMCEVLRQADEDDQLHLICAHPELAGKAATRGELTDASASEQHAAGLEQCNAGARTHPQQHCRSDAAAPAADTRGRDRRMPPSDRAHRDVTTGCVRSTQ